jgi:small-conductance mechanosensitive channel
MKTLTAMVVLIGLCFLAQPVYAQGASFCEQFVTTGSSLVLKACIRELDRQAQIVDNERGNELAGITMSNVDLTKSVKDLQNSLRDIEQKTGRMNPYEASDTRLLTDDLRDRVKDLEKQVDAQGTLLNAQHQQIEDLRNQIETIHSELAKKSHPDAQKAKAGKGP